MKTIITAIALSLMLSYNVSAAETKLVCKPLKGKDGKVVKGKDGKDRQTCKTIKVHKKYEGKKANVKEKK